MQLFCFHMVDLCVHVSYTFKQNVVYGMSLFVFFKLHVDMF